MNKVEIETKLQRAFDAGWIPSIVKKYMQGNNHSGNIWIVHPKTALDENRIAIGYKLEKDNREESHIQYFTQSEAEGMYKESLSTTL
jgi:hypothetical protein